MSRAPLLIEIGCEEIPARMIQAAASELGRRIERILDQAGLERGRAACWGGPRRLAVRVDDVAGRQPDREQLLTGPPVSAAFDASGQPTPAGRGFAAKQGVDPAELIRTDTPRGAYVALRRQVPGRGVGELLAESLPGAVESMSFPKLMRWGDGRRRWVRPVHWLLALHGDEALQLEVLGARSDRNSEGHRFLGAGPVEVAHPDAYGGVLEAAFVVVDPAARRSRLADRMREASATIGGRPVEDPELLDEVADLVEWPGVVVGEFDPDYLQLPRELLVTTLRHHQKCFSVRDESGELLPGFLAVANTDRDPGGHVRRGNEWVIGGRLDDARFFWEEDRKRPIADRSDELVKVVLHAKLGTYADKASRMRELACALAGRIGLADDRIEQAVTAAGLAKNDLVTGTVGEFPELQGRVGGLLLEAEGWPAPVARAVYEHYQPVGPADEVPSSVEGAVVAAADKLDSVAQFVRIGQSPTGSRDPFGLRRAGNGLLRIVIESRWDLSLRDLVGLAPPDEGLREFLRDRLIGLLGEAGYSRNEILAVLRPRIGPEEFEAWPLFDVVSRLDALRTIRGRDDFVELVKLTERVDTILSKNAEEMERLLDGIEARPPEQPDAARALRVLVDRRSGEIAERSAERRYDAVVQILSDLVEPVDHFFDQVLVIDRDDPAGTGGRWALLSALREMLTRYFDVRELAGQADRRG